MRLKNFVGFKNNFRVKGKKIASKRIYGYQKKLWKGVKKTLVPNNFWVKKFGLKLFVGLKIFRSKFLFGVTKIVWIQKFQEKTFWNQKFLFLKNLRSKNVLRLKKIYGQNLFCC